MLDSIGAAVANHFANKLVTTLFSPNRPFFRLGPAADHPDAQDLQDAVDNDQDPEAQAQAKQVLNNFRIAASRREKQAVAYLEKISYRTSATELAKLLIITGDAVIRNPGNNRKASVYTMRDYVALTDGEGRDKILIMRDTKVFAAFSAELQDRLRASTVEQTYQQATEV